jgi:hypothetical protein
MSPCEKSRCSRTQTLASKMSEKKKRRANDHFLVTTNTLVVRGDLPRPIIRWLLWPQTSLPTYKPGNVMPNKSTCDYRSVSLELKWDVSLPCSGIFLFLWQLLFGLFLNLLLCLFILAPAARIPSLYPCASLLHPSHVSTLDLQVVTQKKMKKHMREHLILTHFLIDHSHLYVCVCVCVHTHTSGAEE